MRSLAQLLLDFIWPSFCTHCRNSGPLLCSKCYEHKLEFLTLPVSLELEPCYLDGVWSAAALDGAARSLLHALKYQSVRECGVVCAHILHYAVAIPATDCVTAVPITRRRQWERGFNQAEVIGRELARLLEQPYLPLLKRIKHQKHQASLAHRSQRLTHLAGAFGWNAAVKHLPYSVLLVDDVVTTGTTLNECAKILKAEGVQKVFAVTVAHGQ